MNCFLALRRSPATPQHARQILLVLILPMYMRYASLYDILTTLIVAVSALFLSSKPVKRELLAPIGVAVAWSLFGARLADYVFVGSRLRIAFTYAFAWDGLSGLLPQYLVPGLEKHLPCLRVTVEDAFRQFSVRFYPFVYAAFLTAYLVPSLERSVLCLAIVLVHNTVMAQRVAALITRWESKARGNPYEKLDESHTEEEEMGSKSRKPSPDNKDQKLPENKEKEVSNHHIPASDNEKQTPSFDGNQREDRIEDHLPACDHEKPTPTSDDNDNQDNEQAAAAADAKNSQPDVPFIVVTDVNSDSYLTNFAIETSASDNFPAAKNAFRKESTRPRRSVPLFNTENLYPVDARAELQIQQRKEKKRRQAEREQTYEALKAAEEQDRMNPAPVTFEAMKWIITNPDPVEVDPEEVMEEVAKKEKKKDEGMDERTVKSLGISIKKWITPSLWGKGDTTKSPAKGKLQTMKSAQSLRKRSSGMLRKISSPTLRQRALAPQEEENEPSPPPPHIFNEKTKVEWDEGWDPATYREARGENDPLVAQMRSLDMALKTQRRPSTRRRG